MKYFGTDGVRGVFGETLTIKLVKQVATALLSFSPKRVVIGCDTRSSCRPIIDAMTDVISPSAEIINLGIVPTTALGFLTKELSADLGIMITASHNQPKFNGIKLFNKHGEKLDGVPLERIDELVDPISIWQDYLVERFAPVFRGQTLPKVAIDFANGSGTSVAIDVLSRLGFEIRAENAVPNGEDINLGCGAMHPESLAAVMAGNPGLDIGFAFDGDADRCVVLARGGRVIPGDVILAALAVQIGAKNVVSTVMFNGGVETFLTQKGMRVTRTPVGDRFVLAALKKIGRKCRAPRCRSLGGEPSGHFVFPEIIMTDDGLVSALMILKSIVTSGKTIDELVAGIPVWHSRLFNTTADLPAREIVTRDSRVLVRKSGTENVTRVYIEAKSPETLELLYTQFS
jgi:phosphoglucosamine mutase